MNGFQLPDRPWNGRTVPPAYGRWVGRHAAAHILAAKVVWP